MDRIKRELAICWIKRTTHMRKSVDASGDGRERNGPQVVLFHQLQAVQVGIFEHLLKRYNRNVWNYIHIIIGCSPTYP